MEAFESTKYQTIEVESKIHETELSDVYKVNPGTGNGPLCLKVCKSTDPNSMSNIEFVREAKALSVFNSDYIVKVFEYGIHDSHNYMLLEFLKGKTLEDLVEEGVMGFEDFFNLTIQIVEGIDHMHQVGYLHRDLKDQNIMILGDQGDYKVKIIDLGFALDIEESQTKSGFAGTLEYAAPEQLGLMKKPVDERSDLYSLGVIFYKLLTGKKPIVARKGVQAILEEKPTDIKSYRDDCPPIVARMIEKLLEKNPDDRYQMASSLLKDLRFAQKKIEAGDLNPDYELDSASKSMVKIGKTFVGRQQELKTLVDAYTASKSEGFQAVFVGGRAGIGKSSLIRELEARVATTGAQFAYGKSYEFSKALPAYSLGEAFEDVFKRLKKLPQQLREPIFNKIRESVGGLAAELIQYSPSFAEVFKDQEVGEVKYLGHEKDKQRFISLVVKVMQTISHPSSPLVLLLDDLQWADGLVIDLVETLAMDPPEGTNVLLVGSYRSEEVASTDKLGQIFQKYREKFPDRCIEIEALQYEETQEVIAQSLGVEMETVATDLIDTTFDRTKGNPLFIAEFLKALLAEEIIKKAGGLLVFEKDNPRLSSLGGSIVDLVLKRIEILEDSEVEVISKAALIGLDFSFHDLVSLSSVDGVELVGTVDKAVEQQILKSRGNSNYAFFHDRIHEACQKLMDADDRIKFHLRYLDYIEESGPVEQNKVFEAAEHAIRADDHDRIMKYCILAGNSAFHRHANKESLDYFDQAIKANEVKAADPEVQREMFLGRAEALVSLGNYEKAREALGRVLELYKDNVVESVEINSKIAECLQREGKYKEAQELLAQGLKSLGWPVYFQKPRFGELWDRLLIALFPFFSKIFKPSEAKQKKLRVVADCLKKLWMVNVIIDIKPLLHISYRTLRVSQWLGVSEHLAVAYQYVSFSLMNLSQPQPKRAFEYAHHSIDVGRKAKADEVVAGSLVRLAAYNSWIGQFKDSKKYSDSAQEALTAIGNLWDLGNAVIFSFFSNRNLGRLRDALTDAYTLKQLGERTGSNGMTASGSCKIAETLFLLGDIESYEEAIDFTINLSKENNLKFDYFQALKTKGFVHLTMGELAPAMTCFREAVEMVESGASFFKAYLSFPYLALLEAIFSSEGLWKSYSDEEKAKYMGFLKTCEQREAHYSDMAYVVKVKGLKAKYEGDLDTAKELLQTSHDMYVKQSRPVEAALVLNQLGLMFREEDKDESFSLRSQAVLNLEQCEAMWIAKKINTQLVNEGFKSVLTRDKGSDKNSESAIKALLQIGDAVSATFDIEGVSRAVLDRSIEIFQSERALIFFFDEETAEFEFFIGRSDKREDITEAKNYSTTFLKNLKTAKEALIVTGTEDGALLGAFSAVANNLLSIIGTPIYVNGQLRGAIYLDNSFEKKAYGSQEKDLLWLIAQQIGVLFKLREAAELEIRSAGLEKDLELTGAVQNLILPQEREFKVPGAKIQVHYQPASYSGGDWWWLEELPDGRVLFLNGDVTGHGPGPAMVTAMASGVFKTFIKKVAEGTEKVDNLLQEFNGTFHELCKGKYLMTIQIIEYNPKAKKASIYFSGSPPVWVLQKGVGVDELQEPGSPLGIDKDDYTFARVDYEITPGDSLLFFSDGYYEAPIPGGEQYDIRRARRYCKKVSKNPDEHPDPFVSIITEFQRMTRGCPPDDDTTIALVEFE
ncbi:MAG: SpoIIE family protein phosphatase [Bdellovibrionales bacterium]|nr:SpoIIE family protein phosphatase [Bdellovibrionales bacterium]